MLAYDALVKSNNLVYDVSQTSSKFDKTTADKGRKNMGWMSKIHFESNFRTICYYFI